MANILGYAAAWQREHGKGRIMDDLVRLWRGVPTRHQLAQRIAADKARERLAVAQLKTATDMGMFRAGDAWSYP